MEGGGLSPHAGVNTLDTLDALAPLDCSTCAAVSLPVTTLVLIDSPSSSLLHNPPSIHRVHVSPNSAPVWDVLNRANTKQPLALCRHHPRPRTRHDDHRRILELLVCAIALHSRDKHVPRGELLFCSARASSPRPVPLARSLTYSRLP